MFELYPKSVVFSQYGDSRGDFAAKLFYNALEYYEQQCYSLPQYWL
jgi:hypothetical protein